ncbi:MAG: RNA-binding transcriptional accessory protein [Candidatus Nealsonbacteria bacterium]|nr:RNA-binding transcriptional accessory protein [Candidatus Nealsonbacteria bacterium]
MASIAASLGVADKQVRATVELLDAGNTLPFIARYRKEATNGLTEVVLRAIEETLNGARKLAQRKATILKTIDQQGQLTGALRGQIEACEDKKELENLYLPFKPKRRTRATIARERGLQPLADVLIRQEQLHQSRSDVLRPYVSAEKEVPDEEAALQGACDIVAEQWSMDVTIRSWLHKQAAEFGQIAAQVRRGKNDPASKFTMYFDHIESIKRLPSHRLLAMKRGEAEGVLRIGVKLNDDYVLRKLTGQWIHNPRFEFYKDLLDTVHDCHARLLLSATESATLQELKEKADEEAIAVFAKNLRELLLAPPAGPHVTIGIDPGFRTGCKVAVVDGTGKSLAHATIYPTPPKSDLEGAGETLKALIAKFDARLIAIGNGTASRETDAFVTSLLRTAGLDLTKVVVSESGASIYSASELAVREYPDLDVTIRGAISIAHRLQDPLAELVKIDPKSIGVGQYQHDVNQTRLRECLDWEVQSCVNSVGVDVNMASAPLLSHVAGIGPKLAQRIVEHRDANGPFESRKQLCQVPKLGRKAFEQAAGFLRIRDGQQALDNSAVHPESYYIVKRMAAHLNVATKQLVGNGTLADKLNPGDFVDDRAGLPTIRDILAELAKPGRDPRSEFKVATFTEGVDELEDLREGMILEGAVTNVTHFGAFVDVGVHQDGLIHVSQLANKFIKDPSEVVSVGDVVRVKVLEVDFDRRRIALSRKQV